MDKPAGREPVDVGSIPTPHSGRLIAQLGVLLKKQGQSPAGRSGVPFASQAEREPLPRKRIISHKQCVVMCGKCKRHLDNHDAEYEGHEITYMMCASCSKPKEGEKP